MTTKRRLFILGFVSVSLLLVGLLMTTDFEEDSELSRAVSVSAISETGPAEAAVQVSRSPAEDNPANSPGADPGSPPGQRLPGDNSGSTNPATDPVSVAADNTGATEPEEDEIPAADTPRLSQEVLEVISEVQTRQLDGQWEEALNEMNALYSNYDQLNGFEQATLLNFYTNTLLQLNMWQESISAFNQMLTIPELPPNINARALMALGQLHSQVGETESSISYYEAFLGFAEGREDMEPQIERARQLLNDTRATAITP